MGQVGLLLYVMVDSVAETLKVVVASGGGGGHREVPRPGGKCDRPVPGANLIRANLNCSLPWDVQMNAQDLVYLRVEVQRKLADKAVDSRLIYGPDHVGLGT